MEKIFSGSYIKDFFSWYSINLTLSHKQKYNLQLKLT